MTQVSAAATQGSVHAGVACFDVAAEGRAAGGEPETGSAETGADRKGAGADRKGAGADSTDSGSVSERSVRAVINLHMPLGTALHLGEHEATIDGYGPIPAQVARELLNDPNNAVRKVLTDPDTGVVVRLGRRRYRPSARQRDFIHARDRHCRIPGCRRPIAEIDHARPWHQHGATDPENLQGFCRLNHRLKSLPGWEHRSTATPPN